jgi:hypothetical protein
MKDAETHIPFSLSRCNLKPILLGDGRPFRFPYNQSAMNSKVHHIAPGFHVVTPYLIAHKEDLTAEEIDKRAAALFGSK